MRLAIFVLVAGFATTSTVCSNERPVVGILTQDAYWSRFRNFGPEKRSYIAASYVKSIEASGGQVVPVFTNRTAEYYEYLHTSINMHMIVISGVIRNVNLEGEVLWMFFF